jgi:hypothetical protein
LSSKIPDFPEVSALFLETGEQHPPAILRNGKSLKRSLLNRCNRTRLLRPEAMKYNFELARLNITLEVDAFLHGCEVANVVCTWR